jgi:diaminopimelate decarboxylase
VVIILDNDNELEIVSELLKTTCKGCIPSSIGLRINPVVGAGSNDAVSTATRASKFGLPVIAETRQKIHDLYLKYNWLDGIMFHVGSQCIPLDLFAAAARFCLDLVKEIEAITGRSLKTIDIGGGLSTSYLSPRELEDSSYELYR